MAGDYTRFTFKPQRDYSGVLKQQGRVDLDADFNELIEIIDRRWRSETIDIFNHCIVPNTTPDAFLITPIALGDFEIGIGRMYVDGIQVENHGLPPLEYLADLGEQRGTDPVTYQDQPYLPAPLPPVLNATPNTTDLIYIDVWQREVTVLQDPSLREIALGGPDTANRMQSVWQVRALQNVGDHGCGDDIPAWTDLIAPSAGRLTTSAVAPPAADDPCIISPAGGYRGLENRLYRVEIHAPGTIGGAGPAKFKWSRNNATIASSISAIPSTTRVTVQQVGRDQVLRFEVGNFIEITDDFREFQGLAGHMAQITVIDEANRILEFTPAIPAAINFNAADPTRHTRVLRWDQTVNVDPNGLLDVIAGPIAIEDGINVEFNLDPVGGNFKVGDYWVFAARTADGSVEVLQAAPPRGILHHFCRLGFIHWGASVSATTFTDCRDHWPKPCECDTCTVTVGDGVDSHGQFTDIQQAINALGNRGGIVCIARGFYVVTAGLILNNTKRNVIIRGMGPATRIFFAPPQGTRGVFLNIEDTEQVRLENVFVVANDAEAMIRVTESNFVRIEDCYLINIPGRAANQQQPAARGIDFAGECTNCEIVRCGLVAAKAITQSPGRDEQAGEVIQLAVRRNEILAQQVSILLSETSDLEIVENRMRGLPREAFPATVNISRATIDAFQISLWNTFRATTAPGDFQAAGVIVLTGNRIVISRNLIAAQVGVMGFLFINARIQQNDIVSLIGLLLVFGLVVKFEDNFVLGLFAGVLQAGIVVDFDCTSNEFLGINGIIWMSLAELVQAFQALLTTALNSAGLPVTPLAVNNTLAGGFTLAGNQQAFGLVAIAKVHRNVFVTFSRGIFKTDPVISADVSILDNTFSFCSQVAIELDSAARNQGFLASVLGMVSPRHLVQSNAIAATGRGVVSTTALTLVEQNSIQCPNVAVELDAEFCSVRGNALIGTAQQVGPQDVGLLLLHGAGTANTNDPFKSRTRNTNVSGNRLLNASTHAILVLDDFSGLTIEDNHILRAQRCGIGTSPATIVRNASISRNRFEQCSGNMVSPAGGIQIGGVVVIGASQNLRVLDNVVTNNTPIVLAQQPLVWLAIVLDDGEGIEVSGNNIADNGNVTAPGFVGAVVLTNVRGVLRVQNNIIRNNGGPALIVTEGQVPQIQMALIQNNHISGGPFSLNLLVLVNAVDSLLFQGNQITVVATPPPAQMGVTLLASRANVSGNFIDLPGLGALAVGGNELLVNANVVRPRPENALVVSGFPFIPAAVRVIVTSNLTTGMLAASTGAFVRANNIPPP